MHLHPDWQKLLAEMVVLLYKDYDVKFLLTTHSPYFLRAIEVFANKYDISNVCKYYNAKETDDDAACIIDLNDDLEPVYKDIYEPFQVLEDVYWQ